ncbi:histidine phosphatase family protein [uncultured Croceitalea sp.]|uniref:SixA phosphatase family protein n=1 Tax=uncultured Croceitalea sp. TaxID=1798908 RepID=UPI00330592D3
MKTVFFVRHGKSSWEYNVSDKDRPLKERGIRDASLVAESLASTNQKLDFVFSSYANRALHTAVIVTRVLNHPFEKFQISKQLYDFSGDAVLDFLKTLDDELQTVMVFGHNYAFTTLVNTLGDKYIDNVPTAGLTEIQFDVNQWSAIENGITQRIIFPRDLK